MSRHEVVFFITRMMKSHIWDPVPTSHDSMLYLVSSKLLDQRPKPFKIQLFNIVNKVFLIVEVVYMK